MSSARIVPSKRELGSKKRGSAPPPIHGIRSSFPLILPSPFPWLWFRWIVDRDRGNLVNPFMRGPSQCFVLIKQSDSPCPYQFLSRLFDPGEATEATVPNPSPDRHAATRSRRGSSSSKAVHLGDLMRYEYDRARLVLGPPDFQGSPGAHRTPRDVRCSSQPLDPTSGLADSRVGRLLNRKDNSSRGPADVSGLPNVAVTTASRSGILTRFPFEARVMHICTNGGSTRARALGLRHRCASYSSGPNNCPDGRVWVARFSAIHFRG
ncbi:hypothetical protein ACHQM5_031206 [Ranunculus cassubicifolius]